MPTPRKLSVFALSGLLALLVLSVATCRLDMLLKSGTNVHPMLSVAPKEVRDSARAGSDDIRRASVAITNAGGGTFTWSATKDKGWIAVSPTDGSAPGTLNIALDAHGLAPGTYQGNVTVHAPGTGDSTAAVAVTFVVQRAGLIVTPGFLTRSTNVNSNAVFKDTLRISNSGNGVLVWSASKSKSWVTLGTVAGTGPGSVPVTINSSGLAAGTYTDEIVITAPGSEGSPARIPVTLNVFLPGLAVLPTAIHDSANVGSTRPQTDTLTVTNTTGGTITWTATTKRTWVSLSKVAGGAPPPDSVVVTLNPVGLVIGTYRDTVVFRSPEATNNLVRVPIQFDVVRPVLSVKPVAITDAALPADTVKRAHALAITNAGRGTLAWSAAPDSAWITLSALTDSVADTITVSLDPTGLPPGTHRGKIVVTSPGATGSPDTVAVTLSIGAPCAESPIVPDAVIAGTLSATDCFAPRRPASRADLYSFPAAAGDTISLRLTASFNAYLILTDAAGAVLAQNDECPGETRTACIKNFAVPAAGQYIIEATSFAAGEMGTYTLSVVRERAPAAPQGLGQFRKDGVTAIPVGTVTPEDAVVFKGAISDPNPTDSVRLEIELEPLGSPFTDARTQQSPFVSAAAGSVVVAANAVGLNNTGYHWQARACDRTGRCSTWIAFGGNTETTADFTVLFVPLATPPLQQGAKP
ncbi:MAG TPA: pre-peptidase C-terminal domain-containing protein [Gemmatimonadales bacterium]|nr:pre-peptidase C-terminal domain-containing protein [Gemmatimonadales bacterium]